MRMAAEMIDNCAFAIYRQFISGAVGTCRQKRDDQGRLIWISAGVPFRETPDEAAIRRWHEMPELSRQRFREEAEACLAVAA